MIPTLIGTAVAPPTIEVASIGIPDTFLLMLLALVVFGPRRLPEIGRQIGKLMYEFRKVSNDFKYQMEEELRASEEADRQKKLAASQAAPLNPVITLPETVTDPVPDPAPFEAPVLAEADPDPDPSAVPIVQPPSTGDPVEAARPFRYRVSEETTAESLAAETAHETGAPHAYIPDAIDRAKTAVSQRAELPGMSLFEHLDELRRRIIHSAAYLFAGYLVAVIFAKQLYSLMQAPLNKINIPLNFSHPADLVNLRYIQIPLVGGTILASPFILFQVWLFIAPGLYSREKKYVIPFMASAVILFLSGASLGYYFVFPGLLHFLISDLSSQLGIHPLISIEEYTSFFFSLILGIGATFELPVIIVFLALFGIVSPSFLWKNFRYAILIIFIIVEIITPSPDIPTQVAFAAPMLILYLVGIAGAWLVHPARRKKKDAAA